MSSPCGGSSKGFTCTSWETCEKVSLSPYGGRNLQLGDERIEPPSEVEVGTSIKRCSTQLSKGDVNWQERQTVLGPLFDTIIGPTPDCASSLSKAETSEEVDETIRLLHVACDQQTRGDDPGIILCLVNQLDHSRCGQVRKQPKISYEQDRKRIHEQVSCVEHARKRLKTSHDYGSSDLSVAKGECMKENPDNFPSWPSKFVDPLDRRTPLHRVCAPNASTTQNGSVSYEGDVSDLEDFDPTDYSQHRDEPTVRQQLQPSPATLKQQQWIFHTACLVLGLSLDMSILQDAHGETPLHLLARHIPCGPKEEQVRRLTALSLIHASAAGPQSPLLLKDKEGNTPLHRSIITSINLRGAPPMMSRGCLLLNPLNQFDSVIIQQCPQVLQVQNAKGLTPLHMACRHRSSSSMAGGSLSAYDLILYMARMDPRALLVQDWELGYTPLHYVCANDVSAPLLDMLLQVEEDHRKPIHSRSKRSGSRALLLQDRRGFTPLHLACLDAAPLPVLSSLLRRCPSASTVRDEANSSPLHRLWAANVHVVSIFKCLLKSEGATRYQMLEGTKGELWDKVRSLVWAQCHVLAPGEVGVHGSGYELHAMSGLELPPMVLVLALRLYPEQLGCRNKHGDLPLHIAARSCLLSSIPCDNANEGTRQIVRRRMHLYKLIESGHLRLDEDTQDWCYVNGCFDEASSSEESDNESVEEAASVVSDGTSVSSSSSSSLFSSAAQSEVSLSCAKTSPSCSFLEYSDKSCAFSKYVDWQETQGSLLSPQSRFASGLRRNSSPPVPRFTIDLLLESFPGAADLCDRSGRYPLHLALESGKTWGNGVRALVSCSPSVLGVQDVKTGLYPFMLAASIGRTVEQFDAEMKDVTQATQECERKVAWNVPRVHCQSKREELPKSVTSQAKMIAGEAEILAVSQRDMEVAQMKATEKRENVEAEMRRLTTVYILLSCRPELVAPDP